MYLIAKFNYVQFVVFFLLKIKLVMLFCKFCFQWSSLRGISNMNVTIQVFFKNNFIFIKTET